MSAPDLVVRGQRVVLPSGIQPAALAISGGTITSGVPPSSALLVASSSAVAIFT